jgi:hypothetical protein
MDDDVLRLALRLGGLLERGNRGWHDIQPGVMHTE